MKKCASCSKDLPEAALHCVFCGAKQAAAPAVQPGLAKTAFGYSANEVMQQLGNPQPSYPQNQGQRSHPASQPPPQGYQPPRAHSASQSPPYADGLSDPSNAATVLVPQSGGPPGAQNAGGYGGGPQHGGGGYGNPSPGYGSAAPSPGYGSPAPSPGYGSPAPSPGYGSPAPSPGYGSPAPSPAHGNASPSPGYVSPAPSPAYGNASPSPGYGGPSPLGSGQIGGGMGIHSPPQPTPAPLPAAQTPPYLASQTAARAGRPIDPWKDSLRFMMFVWGAVALATFATPVHVDPMGFNWDVIIEGPGKLKLVPLIWAAAGLLSIACAAIPMVTLPRGIVAAVLGLSGTLVPLFVIGAMPPWQVMLPMIGAIALIPGLLVRHEYTESIVPRVMVTIGVICTLVPYLVPVGGQIPLVLLFKGIIDGSAKGELILHLVKIVLVVTTLLAWMPGPATAGGKIFAWALILFPVAEFAVAAIGSGHIGDVASKQPGMLVVWAPGVVYSVLLGYGLATVIGKQLE